MTATTRDTGQSTFSAGDVLRFVRKIVATQEFILLFSLIVLILTVGSINSNYLRPNNLISILQGNAFAAVAAIGMSMVIISGNIDISVGSVVGVLAVISGNVAISGAPIIVAWATPIVLGILIGGVIGFLVAYLKIPSIVVTLGLASIIKGGLILVTSGREISGFPAGYALSQMRPFDIPMPIYFMVILTIAAAIWMRYSGLGRAIYAVGGNAEAARMSGINDRLVVLKTFMIHGFFVGIASLLFATQLQIIRATVPPNFELLVITASVVGGVSILGGVGTVIGSTIAAVLLNSINSALVFVQISPYWMRAFQGILVLITVLADMLRRRRQRIDVRG
ncbi:ABC transporter permease [Anaerolineae bacterium CFX9]|jgi:ribose/xylose/arabinose/galactoside ABC-type transport system permease subunit|nr:ABC transporter permease [Geitlerinema splendidum]MDK3160580.1 ABC transporter permease [Kamptonema cortianum]MDL1901452.1 ABC transporter permease [Anaerolineae bacterium CFX9]